MAQRITVSLSDEVGERLNDQMTGYGDNRSAFVEKALRKELNMEADDAE